MTYCFGWIYKDTAFLVGDSSRTSPLPPVTPMSSFGELHAEMGGEHVEETLLKLVPVARNCAIAFAGDVGLATRLVQFIKDALPASASLKQVFTALSASMGPFAGGPSVELIVAHQGDGGPQLIRWNTDLAQVESGLGFYQIGSLESWHTGVAPTIIAYLARGNVPAERMLAMVAAVVQANGIHDNMIAQKVGGLMFGLIVGPDGVLWQPDTSYVLYDPRRQHHSFVSALARANVVTVNSSFTNDTTCMANSVSLSDPENLRATWDARNREQFNTDHFAYWIFINSIEKNIVVVHRPSFNQPCQYFYLTYHGSGQFTFSIRGDLTELLEKKLEDLNDRSVPFRITFRSG